MSRGGDNLRPETELASHLWRPRCRVTLYTTGTESGKSVSGNGREKGRDRKISSVGVAAKESACDFQERMSETQAHEPVRLASHEARGCGRCDKTRVFG